MMSMRFLFSRARRGLVGAGLLLLVALAVACGGGGGGSGGGNGGGDNGNNSNNNSNNGGGNNNGNNNGGNGNGNGGGGNNGGNGGGGGSGGGNLDAFSNLPASSVIVPAAAGDGNAVLTITMAGATLQPFARSGFMSDGGETATIALASVAMVIFDSDNKIAPLVLSAANSDGVATATIRFVSAPRVITAGLLLTLFDALDAVTGATILATGAAKISIWHNDAANERYEISPDDGNFGVNSATGLVTAMTDLTPESTYNLTLRLVDRALALTASRSLRVTVGVLPPLEFMDLPASPVVAAAAAEVGDAALVITVTGATLPPFERSGFGSDGGEMATISLASDPAEIFTFDNAIVSLTITLSDSRRTIAATLRFMSAPRVITADLLPIPVAAMDAVVGATILAADAAGISIWHNGTAAIEEYEISPDDGNFGVDSATGLVTATTDLTPDATYDLTLHLIDRGLSLTASRSLEAVVGVLPPLGFVDLPASVVVAAAADMGDAVLTITAAGATLPPFARSGFVSDGGAMATIALASEATVVFDSDNAVAPLTLTLAGGAETATATIRFVSAPRVIAPAAATIFVSFIDAVAGGTILATGAAGVSIWHNGAAAIEEYEISSAGGFFGVDSATGLVTVAMDLTAGNSYDFTLRVIDDALSLTASRSLRAAAVNLEPLRLRYLSTVEWSRDNAYDYLVEQDGETIDLRVVGGVMTDGATRETAFPIYNIWQLQAIEGLQEDSSGSFQIPATPLFGANRLSSHYRLMNDIDAGVTKEWVSSGRGGRRPGQGFNPIGNATDDELLKGGLYGDGYAIRDLWINRPDTTYVGLFAIASGSVIESVGIENARIVGLRSVGALAGELGLGVIQNAWVSGAVTGKENVGGLVGDSANSRIIESRSLATVTGEEHIGGLIGSSIIGGVASSWSTGPVRGGINVGGLIGFHSGTSINRNWSIAAVTGKENVGGLIGNIVSAGAVTLNWSAGSARGDFGVGGLIGRNRHAEVENNWSVASASGEQFVGGLLGRVENSIINHVLDNWSGGAVAAQKNGGGMLGYATNPAIPRPYWSRETSGIDFDYRASNRRLYPQSRFGGHSSMQEVITPLFESDTWHNDDSDLSDNAADFPVLATLDIGLQWAGLAYGLTRVLASVDGAEMAEWGERREMSRRAVTIRIDTNAMAPDTRSEGGVTSTPDCALVGRRVAGDDELQQRDCFGARGRRRIVVGERLRGGFDSERRGAAGDFAFGVCGGGGDFAADARDALF